MRGFYPIALMCRILEVSESGFHAWAIRPPSARKLEDARLEIEVLAAHQRTRETYGTERLHSDLVDHGVHTTQYRVRKLRKKLNLHCKQKRKFKITTNSNHMFPVARNILARAFDVSAPNKSWVSDITYISADEGWLYLAGIKDLYSGELVGYAMNERMTQSLVIQALFRSVANKRPAKGFILHSDRGSQYCAHDYQKLLTQFGMTVFMSRKGDCWDSAPMESFWGTLKMSLYITNNLPSENKPYKKSQNTLRFYIIDNVSRQDWDTYRLLLLRNSTIKHCLRLNPFDSLIDSIGQKPLLVNGLSRLC